jgi:hypothetical protein
MEFMLLVVVGPFIAFATNQSYGRSHHPVMSVLGAFAGGMMFMVGLMGVFDAVLFGR